MHATNKTLLAADKKRGLAAILLVIYRDGLTCFCAKGSKLLTTGDQLRAARALAGINQQQLAAAAGLNTSTISAMENKRSATLGSGIDTIRKITAVLEAAGVEFLDGGVRLRG